MGRSLRMRRAEVVWCGAVRRYIHALGRPDFLKSEAHEDSRAGGRTHTTGHIIVGRIDCGHICVIDSLGVGMAS